MAYPCTRTHSLVYLDLSLTLDGYTHIARLRNGLRAFQVKRVLVSDLVCTFALLVWSLIKYR